MGSDRATAAGWITRKGRALRAEILKSARLPHLYVYLVLVVLATGAWGRIQYGSAKDQERETVERGRGASNRATHGDPFGTGIDEPEAEAPAGPPREERGANGFLALAAGLRAGTVFSAMILLLFAATLLAGEGTGGTCRMLLVRPVTRGDVVVAKAALLFLLAVVFTAAVGLTAFLTGLVSGGYGDLLDVRYGQVLQTAGDLRTGAILCLAMVPLALFAVTAFGLLFSAMFDNSATAITVSMLAGLAALAGNVVVSEGTAGLVFLTWLDRFPGVYEALSRGLSEVGLGSRSVLPGLLVPAGSALVFLGAARIIFSQRDIYQ